MPDTTRQDPVTRSVSSRPGRPDGRPDPQSEPGATDPGTHLELFYSVTTGRLIASRRCDCALRRDHTDVEHQPRASVTSPSRRTRPPHPKDTDMSVSPTAAPATSPAASPGLPGSRRSRRRDVVVAVLRLATAALGVTGVVAEYVNAVIWWQHLGVQSIAGKTLDFVLLFTIQSNLLAAAVFVVGAWRLLSHRPGTGAASRAWSTLRLAATTYLVLTAVVHAVLLSGPSRPGEDLPWADTLVHVVVPVLIVVDWVVSPDRARLGLGAVGRVLAYPIVWVAVTLLRGPVTGDQATGSATYYPYPFLDPAAAINGYTTVGIMVAVLAGVVAVMAAVLVAATRLRPVLASRARG